MGDLGEVYFNLGIRSFEAECYEAAVDWLIRAYESGYKRMQILEMLYASFILPNEKEFRNNYNKSCGDMTRLPYEACMLDFIPVSEDRFYIFDKEQQEFLGIFGLEEEQVHGEAEEFDSILYADTWDIREMLPTMKERNWSTLYIVLNELESRFVSFLKLPQFKELYLENAVVFKDTDLMYTFFSECEEFYLPKSIMSAEPNRYFKLIKELHAKRISHIESERKGVFLSICIPSYNRGTAALKNVRHLLECVYDSEIEIIISNNGSTEDVEGYLEIQKIKDSRVRYHEFEENQGYASNVLKLLELAEGSFAVLCSDEDIMILERLKEYLSSLKSNLSCGGFSTSGISMYQHQENEVIRAGARAILQASSLNYVTGITYNTKILKALKAFEIIDGMRGNSFVEYYVHASLAIIIAKYTDFCCIKTVLWDAREAVDTDNHVLSYMLPDSRIAQQRGLFELFEKGIHLDGQTFIGLFVTKVERTYFLLQTAYYMRFEDYKERYAWEEICRYVHEDSLAYLNVFPYDLSSEGRTNLERKMEDLFSEYLNSEIIRLKCEGKK